MDCYPREQLTTVFRIKIKDGTIVGRIRLETVRVFDEGVGTTHIECQYVKNGGLMNITAFAQRWKNPVSLVCYVNCVQLPSR